MDSDNEPCGSRMKSLQDPDHIHVCSGEKSHEFTDHLCADPKCRRWFYQKEKK